ncbi:MAG TPA: hypothetical protein VEM41_00390 [Actinomycetota bacterium]|nr:hypothetical protein [Actinomycetota bacterium]
MNIRSVVTGIAALGLILAAVALPATPALAASCGGGQGQALLLGCDINSAADNTDLTDGTSGGSALEVLEDGTNSTGIGASGGYTGVSSDGGTYGVWAHGGIYGVYGQTGSTAADAPGVEGEVTSTSPGSYSAGVRGINDGTAGYGIGVYGSQAGDGWGVYGTTPSGYGVYGYSGNGTGVYAEGATALNVQGPAVFSRSGLVSIAAGKSSVSVTGVSLTSSSLVLATVQNNAGVSVKYAAPNVSAGSFTIALSKAVPKGKTANVAWFVVN